MATPNILLSVIALGCFIFAIYYGIKEKRGEGMEQATTPPEKTGMILHFKEGLKIFRLEIYRGITIIYISKHKDTRPANEDEYQYQYFWKGELQYGEGSELEELRTVAVEKIDSYFE